MKQQVGKIQYKGYDIRIIHDTDVAENDYSVTFSWYELRNDGVPRKRRRTMLKANTMGTCLGYIASF